MAELGISAAQLRVWAAANEDADENMSGIFHTGNCQMGCGI